MSSPSGRSRATGALACAMLAGTLTLLETTTNAQVVQGFFERSLKSIPVPEPTDLNDYIADREAAIRLGKALFWDVRLGTDGKTACATCHHQAGVDSRLTNIAHPGADGSFSPGFAPGARVSADHFPTTKFNNPADRFSGRTRNLDDVAGSPGVLKSVFLGNGENEDLVSVQPDSVFTSADGQQRQVTARNAPTVINAAFFVRQFWDGRANAWFNGVNPFGTVDTNAKVWRVNPKSGETSQVSILLNHASLASQAVGPVNNGVEMAAHGRGWVDVARKLLDSKALATQKVAANDGALGVIANPTGNGLTLTYRELIEQAFQPAWRSNTLTPAGTTVTEENMPLYFGLAVQLYEMTLISDDSRYDQWIEQDGPLGFAPGLLNDSEIRGLRLFFNLDQQLDPLTTTPETNCRECHVSPAFSVATYGGKGTGLVGLPGRGVYPNAPDSDNDGFPNHIDALPNNPHEWQDTDGDFIGNNADLDDDGDGIFDTVDPFPLDADNVVDEPPVTPGPYAPLPIAIMEDLPGGILLAKTFEEPPLSAEPGVQLLDFPINGGGVDLYDPYGNLLAHVPLARRSLFPCNFSYHVEKPFPDIGPFTAFIVDASTLNCRYSLTLELKGFPTGDYPFKIDGVQRGVLRSMPFRIYDEGFYNLGVRPMGEDLGVAGSHPNGVPLSATNRLVGGLPMTEFGPSVPGTLGLSPAVANSFKTPSLRNVELTGPYFHNGGMATLEDVIRFYNRGGDFHEENLDTLAPSMHTLNLTEAQVADLAAFLRTLTDERVRDARAPFDHPALPLPDGSTVAAVGESGRVAACATPMYTFEQLLVIENPWFGDCDRNGLLDSCEIARAPELDADGDGQLDSCAAPCPSDISGDGIVSGDDLALLLAAWSMPAAKAGGADVDADGFVGGGDLAVLLGSWGTCP